MSTAKKIWIDGDDCQVRTQDWHVNMLIKLAIQAGFISCYDGPMLVEDYNEGRTDKDRLFNYLYSQGEARALLFYRKYAKGIRRQYAFRRVAASGLHSLGLEWGASVGASARFTERERHMKNTKRANCATNPFDAPPAPPALTLSVRLKACTFGHPIIVRRAPKHTYVRHVAVMS